jgi:sigma-E factor negative regulatory protein RseA
MSDKIAEGLSALLDNESSELDVRRLTRDMTDEDLKTWQRMCTVKSMLHKEDAAFSSVNLLDGIRAGIQDEVIDAQPLSETKSLSESKKASGWKGWLGGMGVAAAVAMAVVGIGLQTDQFSSSGGQQLVSNDQPSVETTEKPKTQTQNTGATRLAASDMTPEQYKALQDKLRSYMQHHAENSSDDSLGDIMPYARVVSFEVDKESK